MIVIFLTKILLVFNVINYEDSVNIYFLCPSMSKSSHIRTSAFISIKSLHDLLFYDTSRGPTPCMTQWMRKSANWGHCVVIDSTN